MGEEGPRSIWQTIDSVTIPVVNLQIKEIREILWEKTQEPAIQRKLILVIVCIALLLDNMLYMVIVPIIPDYLRYIGAWDGYEQDRVVTLQPYTVGNKTITPTEIIRASHEGQDAATGILFASKAIVQLMVNPFSGAIIDKIGYDIPMMIGLTIMFFSTAIFACGRSYSMLFFARSLQGVGSAFADTSGLAMIADRFNEENERSQALGIALAFISFGSLVAPPFGGALYQFAGKEMPFLILSFVCLLDGGMLLLVMKPIKAQMIAAGKPKPPGTPIWRLLMDPYIAICAGALMMSNVALAFLEPTISIWMEDNLTKDNWKIGMIWLPAFFPHVLGVTITVKMAKKYPQHQWLMAAVGLALEGLCCFIVPFSSSYTVLMIPICGICFGIALVDTALLPTLGYLVDVRYASVYGSIYAIADISYSFAYAVGPIIAGEVVEAIGFTALNIGIAFSNLLYAPALIYLQHIYDFKPFENDANILMADPPNKEYQTYNLQEQRPIDEEYKNHLEYGNVQETNIDDTSDYEQGYQGSYQNYDQQNHQQNFSQAGEESYYRQEQPARQLPANPPAAPPVAANPFRTGVQPPSGGSNPFRQGWKDSLFSLPKKWLSTQTDSKDEDDTEKLTLPKLPVPPLKQTLDTYLDYATVIVSNPLKLDVTKKEIQAFSEGIGPQVQEFLEKRREETGNWISEWWQEDMYLAVRNQLPVHSNPGMVFPPRKFTKVDDMADLAATFVEELLDYKEILDNGDLQLERATSREKGQPLCMEQYYRLLGVCRIPNIGKDSLVYPDATHSNQHIVVACRNHFYVIPVVAGDRGRLNHGEIKSQILQVIADATVAPVAVPVGVLTAMNRDSWAKVKQLLVEGADGKGLEENSRSYDIIVKSLCMICLDEDGGDKMECDSDTNAMLRAMHGGGTNYHTANRWFDKTVQLVLSSDGTLGMCYEHSAAEGVAVIRLAERMLMREPPTTPTSPPALLPSPERLIWKIDMSIEGYIEEAKRSIDKIIKDLDFKVFTYKGYGKEFMKSTKTSPDVYIQLALQYTYLKMYGTLTSTYESASLRRFIGGRVDCIRSAHGPALKWAESMCAAAEDGAQKKGAVTFNLYAQPHILERFEAAAKKQTEVMVQNITGQGIDNHLLGLRNGSMIINNDKLPGMFTDETYKMMMEFKLSTSQVATSLDGTFMGYGPVVPDGYGVSYNPKKDSIIFCIASYNSSNQTCTDSFKETLNEVLGNMKMMFTGDDD